MNDDHAGEVDRAVLRRRRPGLPGGASTDAARLTVVALPPGPAAPSVRSRRSSGAARLPAVRRSARRHAGLLFRRWALGRVDGSVEAAVRAALRTIRRKRYCLLVTAGARGPAARVVQPFRPRPDGTVVFGTDPASAKVAEIRRTGRCLLVYQDDRHLACVTLSCEARVLDGPDRPFMPSWSAFWPQGPGTDFVAVECRPVALSMWDGLNGITPPPFGRASRHLARVNGRWVEDLGCTP